MSTSENRALVRRYYDEVLNGRRPERLDDLVSPDFRSRRGDFETGIEGYRAAVLATLAAFRDLRVEVLDQVAEGDLVATRWRAIASLGPGSSPLVLTAMHFHRVVDGRLTDHWEELDPTPLRALR